jgi:glutamyl-tRNA(Gln) amidotransferase subunit D
MNHTYDAGDRLEAQIGTSVRQATYITGRDGMAVVKLDNGYNLGIPYDSCRFLERPGQSVARKPIVTQRDELPVLSIVSTGGTIASRIDYRTGAVTSQFDAADILRAIPGLSSIGRFRTKQLYTILSENMTPAIWQELARAVHEEIVSGARGVIVTHGTDTMAYSAAALSFMLDTPVPVIFVGSQRSADRPSSDNAINALCAAKTAVSELGEVAVVMHTTTSDDSCSVHRATRVRKMHTSKRDAFTSIGVPPIGTVKYPTLAVTLAAHARKRRETEPMVLPDLEPGCGLLSFVPGMDPAVLDAFSGYRGLVLAGTGLGHVSTAWIPALRTLAKDGCMLAMTSQCLNGRVCDRVYDTGRDLIAAGVIEAENMLPETALVKMMWVLGNEDDPDKAAGMMKEDLKGEIEGRSVHGL